MSKTFVFDRNNYDASLIVKGVNQEGQVVETHFNPAATSEIEEFEHRYEISLPTEYEQFLQTSNGGQINPRKACRYVQVDVLSSINGNSFEFDSVGVDFFLTLDRDSLPELVGDGPLASVFEEGFYLPSAFDRYMNDYASLDSTLGLAKQKFLYIVDCTGSSQYIVLAWEGEFKDKVLVVDSSIDPKQPLDNVGILANSFNEFLLSLYCEDQ